MDFSDYPEALQKALTTPDEAYYDEMRAEIMQTGTAEEKRLAMIPKAELRRLHKYGSFMHFSPEDRPDLNRLQQFIQEILEQKLEEKFLQNEQFIAQKGHEFTEKMMDLLDRSGVYWKYHPDQEWLPYLYSDCLEFCKNTPELQESFNKL